MNESLGASKDSPILNNLIEFAEVAKVQFQKTSHVTVNCLKESFSKGLVICESIKGKAINKFKELGLPEQYCELTAIILMATGGTFFGLSFLYIGVMLLVFFFRLLTCRKLSGKGRKGPSKKTPGKSPSGGKKQKKA